MLKRVFKTILILSLSISISLPTNAAISVGDGSSFVTKAEFAADLNNLSNRLAQLENVLDARIDSLVSSYLTRNGIWNAAKQELSDAVKNNREYKFACEFSTGNVGTVFATSVRFCDIVVPNNNKSGLAFGSFGYGNKHTGSANNWYYGVYNKTKSKPGWIWDHNLVVTLQFYQTDNTVTALNFDSSGNITNGELKSVIEIGKCLGNKNYENQDAYILVAIATPQWNVVPFLFFVEKDKRIWWRWIDELSRYVFDNSYNCTAEGQKMKVSFNSLSIY